MTSAARPTTSAPPSLDRGASQAALEGDALDDVRAEEQVLDHARLRFVLGVGSVLWAAIAIVYVPIALFLEPRPLWHSLGPHTLGWLGILGAWAYVRARPPAATSVPIALLAGFVLPAASVAVVSASFRGIVSPFGHGTIVVLAAYAVAVPMPWRRALPWALGLALSWPLGVLAMCALAAPLRVQLEDPRLFADFQETAIAQLVGALLACASQHAQWTNRREVLAERVRHDYRIVARLGRGGMGEVFRAHHPGLGRDVALKILAHHGDASLEARFVREVRATAELTHPGIVRVHDCGATEDGRLFYTMELLEGRTLAQLVASRGPLPPTRAAFLVREASRALATAHARGLVHRDIKPENLFVSDVGEETDIVKVLDFGIAKSLEADAGLTAEGLLVGSPRYMAIEQALGEKVDARADVYALGGVLHFALTGAAPVADASVFAVVAAHAADLILPPSALVPSVPASLDAIVLRCLHRDPSERFASAAELARALDETGLPGLHRPRLDPSDSSQLGATRVDPSAETRVAPAHEESRG
ncbi:MAG: serine/threonine-protein kinase [Sandaracinus sp.]